MSVRKPRRFTVPSHWSAAQADAVVELLIILLNEVTRVYEDPLRRLDLPDLSPLSDWVHFADSEDEPVPI